MGREIPARAAASGVPESEEYVSARLAMVEEQLRAREEFSARVLEAMAAVPRHEFVPPEWLFAAYADKPLPIGHGQTISQPYMVAAMTEAAEIAATDRVLEVGTGSGYQAAVLALLAREIVSVEFHAPLADSAAERLARLGYNNVRVVSGDGTCGWPQAAPFNAILVTAAAPHVPPPLVEQLAEGGRLVIPVGQAEHQELLVVRNAGGRTSTERRLFCRFVPLVGRYGWPGPSDR